MALNPGQLDMARLVYGMARGGGLSHQQALEVVAASYAESGLNAQATNRTSGAAGLFQLLSPGYRSAAAQRGGVYNPQANTAAILPSYRAFFASHPNAAPGEAGAAVERSGQGASFYASPLSLLGGGVAGPPLSTPGVGGTADPGGGSLNAARQTLIQQIGRGSSSIMPVLQALRSGQRPGAPAEAPLNFGSFGGASSGKVSPNLLALTHHFGVKITSGYRSPAQNEAVGGSETSLHMQGRAVDVAPSASAAKMAAYAYQHPSQFQEFFGPMPWYIKNGKVNGGRFPGHGDHYHVALQG